MTAREDEALDWALALLAMAVWSSIYLLFYLRDPEFRRKLRMHAWHWRHRLLHGRRRRVLRAVPAGLARPAAPVFVPRPRPPPSPPASRAATARKVDMAEPIRIAEWRVDNLPLRYRLLGRVRRGANDN